MGRDAINGDIQIKMVRLENQSIERERKGCLRSAEERSTQGRIAVAIDALERLLNQKFLSRGPGRLLVLMIGHRGMGRRNFGVTCHKPWSKTPHAY
jgi:hypothetical protein